MVIPIIIITHGTATGGHGNKRTSGDHPNDSIVEISQNIKKSPGDTRGLAAENCQPTLLRKTFKRIKLKKSEKKDKYLNLARELKKLSLRLARILRRVQETQGDLQRKTVNQRS